MVNVVNIITVKHQLVSIVIVSMTLADVSL